jgi:transcriptional regulator with XRE-family HTH domain
MALRKFLRDFRIPDSAFAAAAQIDASTISRICSGRRLPSLKLAVLIEELTCGQVKPRDFVDPIRGKSPFRSDIEHALAKQSGSSGGQEQGVPDSSDTPTVGDDQ